MRLSYSGAMNTRSLLRIFAALAALGSLGGCASLSKSECLSANWVDVGIRDGANGQPEEYLIQHSKACAKVNIVPDRGAWLHGREQGLERFCVPYRAYQIGENGYGFDVAICRNYDQDRLITAYEKGREVNRLGNQLASIDSEISGIHARLDDEDVDKKERLALGFRLGQLVYERNDTERAYEDARYRARNL
jgi:uncharacterized protein DUF2799